MVECKICGREFNNLKSLSSHIRNHNINKEEYYLRFIGELGKCLQCGKSTVFISLKEGYKQFCSIKCSSNNRYVQMKSNSTKKNKYGKNNEKITEKFKQTSLERYGVENPSQSEEVKEKIKQTNLERYGVECVLKLKETKDKIEKTCLNNFGKKYVFQVEKIKEKIAETNLERYGVKNPAQSEEIKEKIKTTCLKKYGVKYVLQSREVKEKGKCTSLKKYGVDHPTQSEEVKEKIKQTNLERYGVENPSQSEEIKEKKKETCLKKYGVQYPLQHDEFMNNFKKSCLKKYGDIHPLKNQKIQVKRRNTNNLKFFKLLLESDRLKDKCIPLFRLEDYNDCCTEYLWKCTKCENVFKDNIRDGKVPRCFNCYPVIFGTSFLEKEISEFLFSLEIKNYKSRSIIYPKELDIYIPSHKIAIEFDGLYWHSEISGNKDKNYHLNKTLMCQEKGIQLIHIFEDEWIDKQEIVKSIIRAKLGLIHNKIFARKCQIKLVSNDEAKLFLFDNHLQGPINGNHIGLYYEDELVSMITIGKSRFNKNYEYEILRFCNKINTSVVGGLSKLLKYANLNSIITYADLRYGTGESYINCGFKFLERSPSSYFYLKDNHRLNRLQFQKHLLSEKLDIFDSNLTAWQNMQLNGYDRIWDCGTNVFAFNNE